MKVALLLSVLFLLNCCVSVPQESGRAADAAAAQVTESPRPAASPAVAAPVVAGDEMLAELNEELRRAKANRTPESPLPAAVERLEILHFHKTQQCFSCKTVGAFAEKTVNTHFSNELSSGRIVFRHVNIELPENKELAEKYRVSGSSLFIGTYMGGKFYPQEDTAVWSKIYDEEGYVSYLRGVIEKRLEGDRT